jgi:hypothetical protein
MVGKIGNNGDANSQSLVKALNTIAKGSFDTWNIQATANYLERVARQLPN